MLPGSRVIRGPNWKWYNQDRSSHPSLSPVGPQDCGFYSLGSVVDLSPAPPGTVVVQWDCGYRSNYRAGYQEAYDLLLLDNGPAGVIHASFYCFVCNQTIYGMRWSCHSCPRTHLCSPCYMSNKHDLTHQFVRYTCIDEPGVLVGSRCLECQEPVKGIGPGAVVKRGADWEWGDQDGNKQGHVVNVSNWGEETVRSVVTVTWAQQGTNIYRVGHRAKVDLICEVPVDAMKVYVKHLPVFKLPTKFSANDLVKVTSDLDLLKILQEGHGGWNPKMASYAGCVGSVHRLTTSGDIRVKFDSLKWTFNPATLTKITAPHKPHAEEVIREAALGNWEKFKEMLKVAPELVNCATLQGETCLQAACHQGHRQVIELLLQNNVQLNAQDSDGDTALHYSAHGAQKQSLEILLFAGADWRILNKNGSSALHVAVNKEFLECTKVLVNSGCGVNVVDVYGDTVIHDAINKNKSELLEVLVKSPTLDLTIANKKGHNALQYAALKGNDYAVKLFLELQPKLVDIAKEDGFLPLHLAALNNHEAVTNLLVEKISKECPKSVDCVNNRGQSPLMLAAGQGHLKIVEKLLQAGASLSLEDKNGNTTLHSVLQKVLPKITAENLPSMNEVISEVSKPCTHDPIVKHLAVACFLISRGSHLHSQNKEHFSAIDLVKEPRVLRLLLSFRTGATSTTRCHNCDDDFASVTFQPCGHTVCCALCSQRMKKCVKCRQTINIKIAADGRPLSTTLDDLQHKVNDLELKVLCTICLERHKSLAFECGHCCCDTCATGLTKCPFCRKLITKTITLY